MSKTSQRRQAKRHPENKALIPHLRKKVDAMEGVLGDGVDKLIAEINNIHANMNILAEALEIQDTVLAAFRKTFVDKGMFTDAEVQANIDEILKLRQEHYARVAEEQAKAAEAPAPVEHEGVDPSLVAMKKAAEAAATEPIPEGAFVFGG